MTAPFTHSQILTIVRGVALCILLAALDQTIIVPAAPRMAQELGGGTHISWLVAAYLLTGTAATPIFGKLSDIYGRRRLMRPALLIFCAASIGGAVAQTFPEMIAFRALQGIGGAGLMTIAQTAISDVAAPRERGRYQIYMSGMWGIASLGGPLLGGVLADTLSWRAIFWVNLPLGAAAWVLSSRALALLPARPAATRRIDYRGAVLITGAITMWLVLCTAGGHELPWASPVAACLFAAALLCTGIAAWSQAGRAHAIMPLRLFTRPILLGGLLISATNALCTFGASLLLPLYFQYIRHTGAATSGLLMTPFLLAFVVMSFAGGQISRHLGRTQPAVLAALVLCVGGLCGLASMGSDTALALCIFYGIVLGSGIGLLQPCITVAIQNAAERPDVGIATGCMLLFRAIGGAFGATIAGALMVGYGFAAGFGACALVAAASFVIALWMGDADLRRS